MRGLPCSWLLTTAMVVTGCTSLDSLTGAGPPPAVDGGVEGGGSVARLDAAADSGGIEAGAQGCGPNKVACTAPGCSPESCLAPSHVPANFAAWASSPDLRDRTFGISGIFDTKDGGAGSWRTANSNPAAYEVHDGIGFVRLDQGLLQPAVAVFVFSDLKLTGGTIGFVGDAGVVLVSLRDIVLEASAVLDAGARGETPGPGGYNGGRYAHAGDGCGGGKGTTAGAGGGAFGTNGARGASSAGGEASDCAADVELASFHGGSGGGGADDSDSTLTLPFGGAGGGAIQLTALHNLVLRGKITAGGGGGRTPTGNGRMGAGGGSGGAIFLEAPAIAIDSVAGLFANGGGGGSQSSSGCPNGDRGADGSPSLSPALGSVCGGISWAGGNGAAGVQSATDGSTGGGGGGGLGRIILNTLPGAAPILKSVDLSPPPSSTAFLVMSKLGT